MRKLYLISNYKIMMPEFRKLTRKQAENLRKQGYTVEQYK